MILLRKASWIRWLPVGVAWAVLSLPPLARAADSVPEDTRLVRFSQVIQGGDSKPAPSSQDACPVAGCQLTVTLRIGGEDYAYQAIVSFVNQGSYITLEPAAGTHVRIRDFTQPRPGPIFVQPGGNGHTERILRLVLETTGSAESAAQRVRAASEPDAYLRVEITPIKPPQG